MIGTIFCCKGLSEIVYGLIIYVRYKTLVSPFDFTWKTRFNRRNLDGFVEFF